MAEFKLGRIRFVWKGDWSSSTVYYKDDIVRNGGNTYVCVAGHTSSSDFPTDALGNWNKISDGQEWKSNWQHNTYYKENDIVKYGGYLYIANTGHTSALTEELGLEDDQEKWDLFAEGFDYKATWGPSFRYKVNDIVKYNGITYICTVEHISSATDELGLEDDLEKWDVFSTSISWQGDWAIETRYKKNDVVKYGGTIYVCNEGHTSATTESDGLELDQSKWDYFHKGIEFRNNWTTSVRYRVNDVVKYGGGLWICTLHHTSTTSLANDESNWAQFVEALEFEDSWSPTTRYQPGDFITYGGYSYIAVTNNIGSRPTDNPADWDLFTTGFRHLGDYADDSSNQDYKVGDVVRLGGYTYLCIEDHNGQRPPNATYWERLNSGIYWKDSWSDATYYDKGDAVRFGDNSYICVLEHTSDEITEQNRPDQDVTGINWNILAAGPETNVLTTAGDIVYYGGAGPTRLPIGLPGQVLKVNTAGTTPEWAFIGSINNVFYVETNNGVDSPAPIYGTTLDQPWKTVRYATEQIDKGALRPNAKNLLEKNRSFIQAEVVEWVNYQIDNPSGIWIGFTNDNIEKCRRDVGQILDAIIWDISHGGNVRTRLAALSYFDGSSLVTGIQDEFEQLVEALNYGIEVIDAVISNLAPAANYQTLNSVASPITQVVDVNYAEEADAQELIESLMGVITTAVAAESPASIPGVRRSNSTIFVKTGEFAEVLPIIVPADTAVVGDELRSTRIVPADQLIDNGDVSYSLAAITRLQAIISDIITDPGSVVKTTGNLEDPVDTRPVGSLGSTTAITRVSTNADEIIDILTNGVASADALVYTDTGNADALKARQNLVANRQVIIDEGITWIDANYPSLTYDETKCRRDIGYSVDALAYDAQYGGNTATRIVMRSLFNNLTGESVAYPTNDEKTAGAAFYTQLGVIAANIVRATGGYTGQDTSAGDAGVTYFNLMGTLTDYVSSIITDGDYTNIDTIAPLSLPSVSWTSSELQASYAALIAAKSLIQSDAVQHVKKHFPTLTFNENTCSRDIGYMVDALAQDVAFGSNYQSVTAGLSYYRASASVVIDDQLDAQKDVVKFLKYKAKYVAAAGAGASAQELLQDVYNYIDYKLNATGELPVTTGTIAPKTSTEYTYAVESLEANRDFIVAEILAYIADTYPSYTYDTAACSRDVNAYIDAIKFDLIHTGSYKSLLAARYYANAVTGSILEDMFYLREGTGLRNCTVAGLTGVLGSVNSYGTKRPTAGAFTSLDPGWGPNDTRTWIATRSPYIQNVTTFGTACVGCKIDGALHAGGNDSIVANDFTQILSDGIGVWCTNLGRTELVSVFSYYGHIGYLSENGGKIRATNGNSSYGDFGTVAEGVDITETPVTGKLTNRHFQAIVNDVFTNGSQIIALQFLNAGVNYTAGATTITVTGEGFGAAISAVNVVDGGVFEVRMLNPADDFGGADYVSSTNACQTGTNTSITLANTDTATSGQYIGMKIYLVSGLGAGQYGIIDSYNSGTKIANIVKESDGTPGWDHLISGTAIEAELDATSVYEIEPALSFSAPPSTLYADTAKARAVVEGGQIIRIEILDPGQGYTSAPTLTITDPNNTVEAPIEVRIGDGVLAQPTWSARGTGFETAQAEVAGDGYADLYQPGEYIRAYDLVSIPLPGSNVTFASLPNQWFKLVAVRDLEGAGPYSCQLQISPGLEISEAPEHDDPIELRIRYSQVRLTGHDFLDIGTGNFTNTNYPGIPLVPADPTKETNDFGGGRVFYTSTDQDGNFRVGELFSVEQSTGIATLNADAFNITGLQELSLGSLGLGGTGAVITEFSTDGTFTANSDNVVPTQKAIKTYITSQIGGGAATLNVNSITAGQVEILGQQISTTTGNQINVLQKMNFSAGVDGVPVAMNYFLLG